MKQSPPPSCTASTSTAVSTSALSSRCSPSSVAAVRQRPLTFSWMTTVMMTIFLFFLLCCASISASAASSSHLSSSRRHQQQDGMIDRLNGGDKRKEDNDEVLAFLLGEEETAEKIQRKTTTREYTPLEKIRQIKLDQEAEKTQAQAEDKASLSAIFTEVVNCTACPAGTDGDNERCGVCEKAGHCPDEDFCVPCEPGYYSPLEGSANCTACPLGTFNDEIGSTFCYNCTNGEITKETGSTSCDDCPVGHSSEYPHVMCYMCARGWYCPTMGCEECLACPPGSYQNAEGEDECILCHYGTYSAKNASSQCTNCGAGYYLDDRGATSPSDCKVCPAGYYCPNEANQFPTECPSNAYCTVGSAEPTYCSTFFRANPDEFKCVLAPAFYVVVIFGSLLVIGVVVFLISFWKKPALEEEAREEATRLVVEENAGPVYTGL